MKQPINEILRMQQLAGIITESQLNELHGNDKRMPVWFKKVVDTVKDEYNKGNKDNIDAMMAAVDKKIKLGTQLEYAQRGPSKGMPGFMVGNYMIMVTLANKPKWMASEDKYEKEDPSIMRTKVGNWIIRTWD
jgi:hypothetical protein